MQTKLGAGIVLDRPDALIGTGAEIIIQNCNRFLGFTVLHFGYGIKYDIASAAIAGG